MCREFVVLFVFLTVHRAILENIVLRQGSALILTAHWYAEPKRHILTGKHVFQKRGWASNEF